MNTNSWCRSKYWLCHFLNTRHLRPKIDATHAATNNTPLHHFLEKQNALPLFHSQWPINQTIQHHNQDPAFIQAIRLLAKEKQYHQSLRNNILTTLSTPSTPYTPTNIRSNIHKRFSLKFALSIDLIDQIIALTIYQSMAYARTQTPSPTPYQQLAKDTNNHITFYTEYLTYAYANFNFARRNLRRLRLRAMFITALHQTQKTYTPILTPNFKASAWQTFEIAIHTMLPYRRTTLSQNLLRQEQAPYASHLPLSK